MKICSVCLCILFASFQLNAQTLPVARNYQDAYDKKTRSTDGKPGAKYWQNTATYNINVSFDPAYKNYFGKRRYCLFQ